MISIFILSAVAVAGYYYLKKVNFFIKILFFYQLAQSETGNTIVNAAAKVKTTDDGSLVQEKQKRQVHLIKAAKPENKKGYKAFLFEDPTANVKTCKSSLLKSLKKKKM